MTDLSGIVRDLPEAEYHARPELSSTEVRLLLQSPRKYLYRKENPPLIEPIPAFTIGKAVHSLVLGAGEHPQIIPDDILASNGAASTKAAKEWVAEVESTGGTWMKQDAYDKVTGCAEAVLADPDAKELLDRPGASEVSLFADLDGVPCRCRFDFLPDAGAGRRIAVDLKTTKDANPLGTQGFVKSIAQYEYAIQRAFYLDILKELTGESGELVYIAVEPEPPYLISVVQLDAHWREIGHQKADHGRELWSTCTATGEWPNWVGYTGGVTQVAPPFWYVADHEESEGDIQ